MTWTKKHDEFAISCKLRPSARLLLRWLLRRAKLNEIFELEVDLKLFNDWIAKFKGTPYDRKTIREAIAQLDEQTQGLILITKRYTPWVMKLIVRPLSLIQGSNFPNWGKTPKLPTEKPMYSAQHKKRVREQQQQDISKIDTLLTNLGLKYTPDAILKLWRMAGKSVTEVKNAVELMLFQHSTQEKKIGKPHGWLYDCLRYGWQKGLNLYYQVELPYFSSVEDIERHVNTALNSRIITQT
ncbi:MAG: hypothetical protein AAF383_19780 [Cyanobacteria bacterium P01_A01_bin.83]